MRFINLPTLIRSAVVTTAIALTTVAPVQAQQAATKTPSSAEKETARTLMQTGDAKLAAGEHQAALDAYLGADRIMGVPSTALAVGRAYAKLGQLVEAVDALQRAGRYPVKSDEPEAFSKAREEAKRLDADIARRIPTLLVNVAGPSPDTPVGIAIDGRKIEEHLVVHPNRVNPGKRVVLVTAPGYYEKTVEVTLADGEKKTIDVSLEVDPNWVPPEDPPPPPPGPTPDAPEEESVLIPVAIVGFSVGGAGLVLGAVTGGLSLSQLSDLEASCGGTVCTTAEQQSDHDTAVTLANVSNAGFIIGGVGVAVGAIALIVDAMGEEDSAAGDSADQVTLTPIVGPGSIGLHGSF